MSGKRTNAERLGALEDRIDELVDRLEASAGGARPVIVQPAPAPPVQYNPRPLAVQTIEHQPPPWYHQPPPWMQPQRSEGTESSMRMALEYLRVFMPLLSPQQGSEPMGPERLIELVLALQKGAMPAPPTPDPEPPAWKVALENPLVQATIAQRLGVDLALVEAFAGSGGGGGGDAMEVDADALSDLLGGLMAGQAQAADPGDPE